MPPRSCPSSGCWGRNQSRSQAEGVAAPPQGGGGSPGGERGASQIPHQRLSRRRWADARAQSPPALSLARHGPATRDGPHQAGGKHQHHGGTRGVAGGTEFPRAGVGSAVILPEPGVWLTNLNSQLLEEGARSAVRWRRAAPWTTKAPAVGGACALLRGPR